MPTACRRATRAVFVTGLLAAMVFAQPVAAQIAKVHLPERPLRGAATNLFFAWEGTETLDGLLVELPADWSLRSAAFLPDAYRAVAGRIDAVDGRRYHVLLEEPLQGRMEIILTIQVGESYTGERLDVFPLTRIDGGLGLRRSFGISATLRAFERKPDRDDQVLSFGREDAEPLAIRPGAGPELTLRDPFTLSFWMKSTRLGEVVLSTWNGDDALPYPVEMVVDRAGRLHSFRGRPGEHQALSSDRPVADGSWHHVTLQNDPSGGWTHLIIDGRSVDSLFVPVVPNIRMERPIVVGGRADGENPYFDGLTRFSGFIDELVVTGDDASGESRTLALGFDQPLAEDVTARPVRGVERIDSDRHAADDVQDLRVEHQGEGVVLSWRAQPSDTQEFVVERSSDGASFHEISRMPPTSDGEYRVRDVDAVAGVVYYRVRQVLSSGMERVSGTIRVGVGDEQPSSVRVIGNYPNPFNVSTVITYEVREYSDIQMAVWDLSGQPVKTLVDRRLSPGTYQARFEGDDLPSGTYFVRLRTPHGVESHKLILAK